MMPQNIQSCQYERKHFKDLSDGQKNLKLAKFSGKFRLSVLWLNLLQGEEIDRNRHWMDNNGKL